MVVGIAVVSHWLLDLVVHVPDRPLYPGGRRVGLGLWESLPGTLLVELALFAIGVGHYLRATAARNATGRVAFWSLVAALMAIHLANTFGAPPPSVPAIAWLGQAPWLLMAWGYWVDRHRSRAPCGRPSPATGRVDRIASGRFHPPAWRPRRAWCETHTPISQKVTGNGPPAVFS